MNGKYVAFLSASETEWVVAFLEDGVGKNHVTFWGNDSVEKAKERAEEYAAWKNEQLGKK